MQSLAVTAEAETNYQKATLENPQEENNTAHKQTAVAEKAAVVKGLKEQEDAHIRQRAGDVAADHRSSSGECTSGESQTEKQAGDSGKESCGSQAKTEQGQGRPAAAEPAPSNPDSAATANANSTGVSSKAGRSKLPRPEGTCPCPRCGCEDTKFCYYNNYNIQQPRYFCKGCQRYWTAGGMLRNVPVGAGRRNKGSKSKAAKGSVPASAPPVMPNPLVPTLGGANAYAHNRHVLWDPAEAVPQAEASGSEPGRRHGAGGAHGPAAAAAPNHASVRSGADISNGSSMNSSRSNLRQKELAGTAGAADPSSAAGAADAPRHKIRRHSSDEDVAMASAGMPGYIPPGAGMAQPALPCYAPGVPPGYPVPLMPGQPAQDMAAASGMDPSAFARDPRPPSSEAAWLAGHNQAAAAAYQAAYQAAAVGQQPVYWPGISPWPYAPWGNSAVAGWAAAAAAVYHAGTGSCWPHPGAAAWGRLGAGAAPMAAPSMHGVVPPIAPGMQSAMPGGAAAVAAAAAAYAPGAMVGYPGAAGPWAAAWPAMGHPAPLHAPESPSGAVPAGVPAKGPAIQEPQAAVSPYVAGAPEPGNQQSE
mmetsp:Transcript_26787/g.63546  ORF Transcript_26787/g.63546 Transcript_26787/m.63546 type:complete len:588 (-) Transcript_26787:612-2375(-)